jgi:hypothetical protein
MNDIQKLLAEAMRTPGTTIITKANFRPAIEVSQGLVAQTYQHSQCGDVHRMPQKSSLRRYLKVLTKHIVVFIGKISMTRRMRG